MNSNYLTGPRLKLRAVEPEDLDVFYSMENDPEIWTVTDFNVPYSKYAIKRYIANCQNDLYADRQLRLMLEHREEGCVVGTIDLTEFSPLHAHGEVGISVKKEFQGKGYAKEALELLCEYAFGFLHMKQLIACVRADNLISISLFTSCGFVKCGLLKEWWRSGNDFTDVLLMQRLW